MWFAYSLKHTFTLKSSQYINILILFPYCIKNTYTLTYTHTHTHPRIYLYIVELISQTFIGLLLSTLTYLQYNNHQLIVILPNSWPSLLQWQNVTFRRNCPISSGTASVDSKFRAAESFKRQPKRAPACWGGIRTQLTDVKNPSELCLLTAW